MNQNAKIIKFRKMVVKSAGSTADAIYFSNGQVAFEASLGDDGKLVVNKKTVEDYNYSTPSRKRNFFKFSFRAIFELILSICLTLVFYLFIPKIVFIPFAVVFLFFSTITAIMINIMLSEFYRTNNSSRSKHSAEHMMANFIEKHNRLPRSLEEIYSSSRFSEFCGSKNLIYGIPEAIISGVLSSVIAIILYFFFYRDQYIAKREFIVIEIVVFICSILFFLIFQAEFHCFAPLTVPLENWLNFLIQLANTTPKKYVDNNDIILAFYAASEWQKEIYPEYYNEEAIIAFLNNFPDE